MWRVEDRALLWRVPSSGEASVAAFAPDSSSIVLATGARDMALQGSLTLYFAQDGTLLKTMPSEAIRSVAVSPTGTLISVATGPGVPIPAAGSWSEVANLPGDYTTIDFSPDGTEILAGSSLGTLSVLCDLPRAP